jgi:Ca2+-binding RTX toxin-like protein
VTRPSPLIDRPPGPEPPSADGARDVRAEARPSVPSDQHCDILIARKAVSPECYGFKGGSMAARKAFTTDMVSGADNVGAVTLGLRDMLFVGMDASLVATGFDSDGVRAAGGTSIFVNGEIFGSDDGIHVSASPTAAAGNVTINDGGSVSGGEHAIFMTGIGASIVNAGTLMGESGIWLEQGKAKIVNTGSILANAGGEAVHLGGANNRLVNYGKIANSSDNAIVGGSGADVIVNNDVIIGDILMQDGNDRFVTHSFYEGLVDGGKGNDTILSDGFWADFDTTPYVNVFLGGAGDDVIRGGAFMRGGDGNDRLKSTGGSSEMSGGLGNDDLRGTSGFMDHFRFAEAGTTNADFIRGFDSVGALASDVIELDDSYFSVSSIGGSLAPDQFHIGAAATTAAQRIIYDGSGAIFYDKDGNGLAAAERLADISLSLYSTGATLAASDFLIV